MNCFVCNGEMSPFLQKNFGLENLSVCEYVRCENCGLVVAKTLYEMPHDRWQKLNRECHAAYQNSDANAVDPNWLPRLHAQAELLSALKNFGVIDSPAVDYGAGDGKLSAFVRQVRSEELGVRSFNANLTPNSSGDWLQKFDEFMARPDENYLSAAEMTPASFNFVITCSVFEHLLGGRDVEKIFGLLTDDGTAAIHTLVCEEVPHDSSWFYLLPVHATFWTNDAMKKIFAQYKFVGCAYHVEARLWLFFRDEEKFSRLKTCADKISGTLVTANDFVDYWKSKPYR